MSSKYLYCCLCVHAMEVSTAVLRKLTTSLLKEKIFRNVIPFTSFPNLFVLENTVFYWDFNIKN